MLYVRDNAGLVPRIAIACKLNHKNRKEKENQQQQEKKKKTTAYCVVLRVIHSVAFEI